MNYSEFYSSILSMGLLIFAIVVVTEKDGTICNKSFMHFVDNMHV